jgi:hypothetical protein
VVDDDLQTISGAQIGRAGENKHQQDQISTKITELN